MWSQVQPPATVDAAGRRPPCRSARPQQPWWRCWCCWSALPLLLATGASCPARTQRGSPGVTPAGGRYGPRRATLNLRVRQRWLAQGRGRREVHEHGTAWHGVAWRGMATVRCSCLLPLPHYPGSLSGRPHSPNMRHACCRRRALGQLACLPRTHTRLARLREWPCSRRRLLPENAKLMTKSMPLIQKKSMPQIQINHKMYGSFEAHGVGCCRRTKQRFGVQGGRHTGMPERGHMRAQERKHTVHPLPLAAAPVSQAPKGGSRSLERPAEVAMVMTAATAAPSPT